MTAQDNILKSASGVFSVFAHPARLKIVMLLHKQEQDVTHLQQELQISQSSVSQHLGILKLNHLVTERREGKHVFYSLKNPQVVLLVASALNYMAIEFAAEAESLTALTEFLSSIGM